MTRSRAYLKLQRARRADERFVSETPFPHEGVSSSRYDGVWRLMEMVRCIEELERREEAARRIQRALRRGSLLRSGFVLV